MHCPPGYCRQYVNPQGLLGATSLFNKCYDPATGDMVDGVWTGSLTDVVAPEGWVANPEDCPEPTPVTAPVAGNEAPVSGNETESGAGLDQYADIITDCGIQIGAAVACFTTSQEPACEGFDPMSLIGGDLPIPDDCEGGVELVCAALVGCCDQEIVDIAACAAQSQGLDCDIDCGGDPTSAGSSIATAATSFVLAALVATFAAPL
jgi:hypothetical protein